jgi:phosphoribosylglycinamide formyltransferase 1
MKRIAVFASGQGSNAANLIRYFQDHPKARICWVASNRASAPVLQRAAELGVEATYIKAEDWTNGSVLAELRRREIDLIVLAGFLKLVPASIIHAYDHRIVNIHPALLPKFGGAGMYGMNVHRAVVAAGEKETGITIHYVNEHFDKGEVIAQYKTEVLPTDKPEDVERKVRELENKYFGIEVEQLVMGDW